MLLANVFSVSFCRSARQIWGLWHEILPPSVSLKGASDTLNNIAAFSTFSKWWGWWWYEMKMEVVWGFEGC